MEKQVIYILGIVAVFVFSIVITVYFIPRSKLLYRLSGKLAGVFSKSVREVREKQNIGNNPRELLKHLQKRMYIENGKEIKIELVEVDGKETLQAVKVPLSKEEREEVEKLVTRPVVTTPPIQKPVIKKPNKVDIQEERELQENALEGLIDPKEEEAIKRVLEA